MPKKPEVLSGAAGGAQPVKRGVLLSKVPVLASYLCDLTYESTDERRLPSYLIIRPQSGVWHVTLKDPSTGLQLRASCDSYDLVTATLEGLLTSPGTPWEPDPFAQKIGNGKRRKSA